MKLIKKGNSKIDKSCNVFNLPTHVCQLNCPGCYALKAEKRFPAVLASRNYNHRISESTSVFITMILADIDKSKNTIFRVHESGDFYSQAYVLKWKIIAEQRPDVRFYAYTKKKQTLDLSSLVALPNFNIIDSMTPLGVNYGDKEYCDKLVSGHGYTLCPCAKDVHVACMKDCQVCLTIEKICFLKH